jgi:hypothetical protein
MGKKRSSQVKESHKSQSPKFYEERNRSNGHSVIQKYMPYSIIFKIWTHQHIFPRNRKQHDAKHYHLYPNYHSIQRLGFNQSDFGISTAFIGELDVSLLLECFGDQHTGNTRLIAWKCTDM